MKSIFNKIKEATVSLMVETQINILSIKLPFLKLLFQVFGMQVPRCCRSPLWSTGFIWLQNGHTSGDSWDPQPE